MSCARHIDAITDHAFGAEIAAGAAGHLEACPACRAQFEDQRRLLEGLDGELQRALAIVPSTGFARRVHARIDEQTTVPSWALWWSAYGAAAVILLVVGMGVLRSLDVANPPLSDATLRQPATAASNVPAPPVDSPVAERVETRRPATRPFAHLARGGASRARPAAAMPSAEVLVPADHRRAIAHLVQLVRTGRLDASKLPVSPEGESAVPVELVIRPLEIEAIAVPDVEIPTGTVPAGRNSQ
jgi:hypothetical protein